MYDYFWWVLFIIKIMIMRYLKFLFKDIGFFFIYVMLVNGIKVCGVVSQGVSVFIEVGGIGVVVYSVLFLIFGENIIYLVFIIVIIGMVVFEIGLRVIILKAVDVVFYKCWKGFYMVMFIVVFVLGFVLLVMFGILSYQNSKIIVDVVVVELEWDSVAI